MNDLIGNVREARFIIKNPTKLNGKTFFCGNDDYESPNNVTIKVSGEYFTNEWTEWSKEGIQEFFSLILSKGRVQKKLEFSRFCGWVGLKKSIFQI